MSQFELFLPQKSWVHALDPRAKLWAVIVLSSVALAYRQIALLAGLLVLAHGLLLAAHIPAPQIRWLWSRLLPLLLLILLLQPVFAPGPGPDLLRLGPLRWTVAGLLEGASYALRASALAFVAAILLLTTEPSQLVDALAKLGMPYTWALTVGLAVRYLPDTHALFLSIREAQEARGWIVGRGRFLERARSYLPVLVATIIESLRRADRLGLALASRGLGYARHRTALRGMRLRAIDWLALALTTVACAGLMVLRYWSGWGGAPWS